MKLDTKKVFFVGLAFLIICLFWQIYDSIIAKMLINTFGLNQTWSGVVMALDNILALFLLPLFGTLSDKTNTKWGKRTPYIFFGVIVSAIFLVGVSIFDNVEMKKLEDENCGYVVEVNNSLLDEENEYHYLVKDMTEKERQELLEFHTSDYWYKANLTTEQIEELLDFNNKKTLANNIDKYYTFVLNDNLSDSTFVSFCETLIPLELSEYSDIIYASYEDRVKVNIEFKNGLSNKLFGKKIVSSGSRSNQKEIDKLNKLLCQKLVEKCDYNEENIMIYLNSLGLREFYNVKENATLVRGKVAWKTTKGNIGVLVGFLGVLLIVLLAMATFRTPAVSLMPDVVIKPLRSKANAVINLMGTVGGIISLLLMSFIARDYHSYLTLFIIVGLIMIVLLVVYMFTVNEPKLVDERVKLEKKYDIKDIEEVSTDNAQEMSKEVKKSFYLILLSIIFWYMAYNAATTKFSVYAGDVLNMGYSVPLLVANATALICFIPIGIIASKVGRKKTILAGVIILFVAFLLGSFATEKTKVLIYVTMGLAGIGWATINVNSYPMIVEMSKNNNVGKYTGYYYTASMFAQIITPILSGAFMDITGTMRVLFPYSVFFCLCAFVSMMFVKHGDSKPIAVKSIEAFDVDD